RIIIPGVGHAGAAMQKLQETGLVQHIIASGKPVLGICVGMQLLTAFSEEGSAELLNIVPLKTLHFESVLARKFHTWDGIVSCPRKIVLFLRGFLRIVTSILYILILLRRMNNTPVRFVHTTWFFQLRYKKIIFTVYSFIRR